MSDLFSSPLLRIEQQSTQLEYQITGQDDRIVGQATQAGGRKPRKGFFGWLLGSGIGSARIVVQVVGPDGAPLFYVDHQAGAPTAVVAVDGSVIGRLVHDRFGEAQQITSGGTLAGMGRMVFSPVLRHRLEDAGDRVVCRLEWTLRPVAGQEHTRWIPVACDYTDMSGTHIAHVDVRQAAIKDRYVLQLGYQLPEPLRTLVIASPLAYDLSDS